MNYSYQNGRFSFDCSPEEALELIIAITDNHLINSPLKKALVRGIQFSKTEDEVTPEMLREMTLDKELLQFINSGSKLAFVKRVKEITGLGLKSAKDIADIVFTDFKR